MLSIRPPAWRLAPARSRPRGRGGLRRARRTATRPTWWCTAGSGPGTRPGPGPGRLRWPVTRSWRWATARTIAAPGRAPRPGCWQRRGDGDARLHGRPPALHRRRLSARQRRSPARPTRRRNSSPGSRRSPSSDARVNGSWAATGTTSGGRERRCRAGEWIDSVTPNNPVFVNRLDGHMGLANSAALRAAGISPGHARTSPAASSCATRGPASRPGSSRTARWSRWSGSIPDPPAAQRDAALASGAGLRGVARA